MTEDNLVTVIVPIYNVEPFLSQCINSIISQNYSNLEIILVDDGSPDRCPDICDEYKEKDSRIKVIHKSRNAAILNTSRHITELPDIVSKNIVIRPNEMK